jgi:nucleotide-binding universal stress UspA family protein
MFKTILVCSDGSDSALKAARTAARIACKTGSELILLNVFDDSISSLPSLGVWELGIPKEDFVQYASRVQQHAEARTAAVFAEADVPFLPLREIGSPVEIILSVAERKNADLIVMGSRGLGGFKSLTLGSVSDAVAHHASCPVLIERGNTTSFRRILLASDGSTEAQQASSAAFALAKWFGAELTVLNVFEPFGPVAAADYLPDSAAAFEEQSDREKTYRAVEESLKPAEKETGIPYFMHQERGHPAKAITDYAELGKFDLVVLGNRGLGKFDRLLLGSVSDAVLHHANSLVLIVR